MTMILDPTIRSLREYLRVKERHKNSELANCLLVPKRPDACPHCSEEQCFWIKAYYFRRVVEGELTELLRVPRYICKCCGLVLSVLFAFLVPFRQHSVQTLVRGVQDYILRRTSYRKVASSIGNNEDSIQRPSHSQIWQWVQLVSTRSFENLEIALQRACVTAGKEKQLTPASCPNSAFARHLGWPQPKVNEIITGKRGITPETAMVFADAFGTTAQFWLNAQLAVDLWNAKKSHRKVKRLPQMEDAKLA